MLSSVPVSTSERHLLLIYLLHRWEPAYSRQWTRVETEWKARQSGWTQPPRAGRKWGRTGETHTAGCPSPSSMSHLPALGTSWLYQNVYWYHLTEVGRLILPSTPGRVGRRPAVPVQLCCSDGFLWPPQPNLKLLCLFQNFNKAFNLPIAFAHLEAGWPFWIVVFFFKLNYNWLTLLC